MFPGISNSFGLSIWEMGVPDVSRWNLDLWQWNLWFYSWL